MLYLDSVEVDELNFPLVVHEQRIEPDTEGAGRFRGAPSARVEYGPVAGSISLIYASDGQRNPAAGARGGGPGAGSRQYRRRSDGGLEELPGLGNVTLLEGETVVTFTTAGGGYGSPWQRDVERVRHDVVEGWITADRARDMYGVAVTLGGAIDSTATEALRAALADQDTNGSEHS
jgi:N-methylhydantoinase B